MTDLHSKVRKAYLWTFAGSIVKQTLSFSLSLLLARFLSPQDYGLIGIVGVFVGILCAIQDAGLAQAVIFFDEDDGLRSMSTFSTLFGFVSCALLCGFAPAIASFYHCAQLVPVIRVMSLSLVLAGLRSVSQALVTKHLLFKKIAVIETLAGLSAAAIAVFLAWKGFGVWSLVVNVLLSSVLMTAMMLAAVRPGYTLRPDFKVLKKAVNWGFPLTGSSLLWNLYDNSDDMIVGRLTSPLQLGFYTFAFRMATLVNERIGAIVGRVSFPSLAAMRHDRHQVVEHWLSVTRKAALLSFPILVMLGLAAQDFVASILGPKWLPSVPILRILCVAGAIRALTPVTLNLLPALGKTRLAFGYTLMNAVVMPLAFVIGCKFWETRGVAMAWVCVFPFLAAVLIRAALRLTYTTWRIYFHNIWPAIRLAGAVGLAMLPFLVFQGSGFLRLLLSCTTGTLVFVGGLYRVFRLDELLLALARRMRLTRELRSVLAR